VPEFRHAFLLHPTLKMYDFISAPQSRCGSTFEIRFSQIRMSCACIADVISRWDRTKVATYGHKMQTLAHKSQKSDFLRLADRSRICAGLKTKTSTILINNLRECFWTWKTFISCCHATQSESGMEEQIPMRR
jgi:hypothetical protein